MKKIFLGLVLIIATHTLFSQSNDTQKDRKFSFQISPFLLAADLVQLSLITEDYNEWQSYLIGFEFQYALNNYLSLSVEPRFGIGRYIAIYGYGYGYGSNGVSLANSFFSEREKNILFTLNPGLLYRVSGTGLKGWYFGVYPTFGWKNVSSPSVNDNFFVLGITGGTGYQWVFRGGFTISLGGGLGRTWDIANKANTGIYDSRVFLVDFIFNFKLGYSF